MKLTPLFLSFFLCLNLCLNVSGQSEVQEPAAVELEEKDDLIKAKWRHVGFHLISDWQGEDIETVLDEPSGQVWHALASPSKYCLVVHALDATHSSLSPLD